ncbi:MAG: methylmalonyl Co-A mutase-associated GTPase MeaB [Anaerolineales bacterium]|jgi:LAO/AO transport system kinase|nr:methylmalonyl Co-A mutase-associated GTPase MeaB [Anaerolineales bacterium]
MIAVESLLNGNRLALARTLTQIENNTPEGRRVLDELFLHTGQAHLVGVTGAPGTGKSSLVNQLARYYRNPPDGSKPRRVAVVAVDPSSPFTGGAILGDRVRMRDLSGDPGVFIRSMASRGSLGGLAVATSGVVQALDAAGFELVMIETVGAGQAEVDIARLAHTTLVVEAPGLGDDIQAIKAGILEIADILVINKADRPGVENTERALKSMLQLAHPVEHVFQNQVAHHQLYPEQQPAESADVGEERLWEIPLTRTVATTGEGVGKLGVFIDQHRAYLKSGGGWSRREKYRLQSELDSLLQATLVSRWRVSIPKEKYISTLEQVMQRQVSPWQAVKYLLDGSEA